MRNRSASDDSKIVRAIVPTTTIVGVNFPPAGTCAHQGVHYFDNMSSRRCDSALGLELPPGRFIRFESLRPAIWFGRSGSHFCDAAREKTHCEQQRATRFVPDHRSDQGERPTAERGALLTSDRTPQFELDEAPQVPPPRTHRAGQEWPYWRSDRNTSPGRPARILV